MILRLVISAESEIIWARDCTQVGNIFGATSSNVASTQQSVRRGTMRGRRGARRVGFSGLNVVYDEEGYDYPVDDERRIYVLLDLHSVSEAEDLENTEKQTKS